ncbi:MAG: LarC family nickel insertion protein [Peptococcaceae bacterium]|nr:LarC family nickel insertion protein [Candidatus Syntrophopropionicum ammoniitolerans]
MIGRQETVIVLEATIDDMNPEIYSYLLDTLIKKKGALDAYLTPIYMKKNRPANLLSIICREEQLEKLLETVFRETTTLGVRVRKEQRRVLPRSFAIVKTPWGEVKIKIGFLDENKKEIVQYAPEYEACRHISEKHGIPLKEVYNSALQAFVRQKENNQND